MSRPLNQADVATTSQFEHKKSGVWYWDTISSLVSLVTSSLTTSYQPQFTKQYASPATGESVAMQSTSNSLFVQIKPSGTIATLGLAFPSSSNYATDGQEVIITTSNTITALALDGNGATIQGAATTLSAENFLRYRYDSTYEKWIRIG